MSNVNKSTLACNLAPEDITPGIYVTVINIVHEHVSCFFEPDTYSHNGTPKRSILLPEYTREPMKVIEVCLPFVYVVDPDGDYETLDIRRKRLAKLSDHFGEAAFMRAKAKRDAKKRKRKRRRKKKKSDD